jgi:fructose-1,6-bisphosphatase/inositol monophosphatase family enzyme
MIPEKLKKLILSKLNASEVHKSEIIQELWSGYGELTRVTTDKGSVIVKLIKFPSASGIGHQRKVKSYKVEAAWYKNFEFAGVRMAKGLGFGEVEGSEYLLLEDLGESGFEVKRSIEWEKVELCLKWLAGFHKKFMGVEPSGLWETGTYWHLETRPEEFKRLEDKRLKNVASLVDQKLNSAKYQTIVHGDAKLANFLFNDREAAAVDFQYVGGGVGIKDVAYFLSSLYHEDKLFEVEEKALDTYFRYLDMPEVEKEWRELYPIAWCDFYRFLQGWSPGHWKIHGYSESMKNKALNLILLDLAKEAALAAGKVIADFQGSEIQTELKEGGTSLASKVVTEVDLKAQMAILEILEPTLDRFDLGLLTEESPDDNSRFERDYFWCIDPLDGTLPFSKNESGYSTSIALVSRDGEAILGVVFDPRNQNLYYALDGHGAFKNDEPFVMGKGDKVSEITGPGGAVMQAIETIEKAPCLFYKKPKPEEGGGCLWDYAATSVIQREAGGFNSDFSFQPLNLNSQKSLYMNHCGVIYAAGLTLEEVRQHF